MRESCMANAKPPECNSISTTEVAVTDITKGGFNGYTRVSDFRSHKTRFGGRLIHGHTII